MDGNNTWMDVTESERKMDRMKEMDRMGEIAGWNVVGGWNGNQDLSLCRRCRVSYAILPRGLSGTYFRLLCRLLSSALLDCDYVTHMFLARPLFAYSAIFAVVFVLAEK